MRPQSIPRTRRTDPDTEAEGGASLEKVRDLLFGVQMRDYDRKFARLEERLVKETSDLREDVKKRLAAIEQLLAEEVETLNERLKTEQDERVRRAAKDLSRQLEDTGTDVREEDRPDRRSARARPRASCGSRSTNSISSSRTN